MIVLAATPIGNLGDASRRLVETLSNATVVAAEDTRTAIHLMRALGIENRPRLIALHEHNERAKASEVVELARDEDVVVLTDAGMPAISDPGFPLVEAAAAAGVTVTALPGPSAVLMALAVSGLPTDRFTFEGFPTRKAGERRRVFQALAGEQRTMVFFESPHRLAETLADMAVGFGGDRRAAVCRELTKLYEEVRRGPLDELVTWASVGVRGEICIVVAGAAEANEEATLDDGVRLVLERVAAGMRMKEAAAAVADATGLSKRDLYEGALAAR
ncbi:16S rRNA (cytidine(1402)-2'-O)-methyltransferase [Curtobacterium flaccumfaciens]|uniref:16S rRNA (cytidine(1402)-2'-O)-methyltransferase n=1 Tax=Curtobacterium flaccumfaciens TaxID=2035 RepID=UPI001BDECC2D|nr:16S rRNA (cytidine(1402)-2'-O)-methyltransferase [Curtobacterium flaccumfaciens]MBT1597907.1 16S rRNA (cytidine(1402)-2'-O)-methyltransferase [Curtobacterium flaccumfaciens pv. flaccumfaciens]